MESKQYKGRLGSHILATWGVVWPGGKPLVAGRVLPFVGVRLRWWAVVSVRARLPSLVAVRDVVAGGVVVRVHRGCYR